MIKYMRNETLSNKATFTSYHKHRLISTAYEMKKYADIIDGSAKDIKIDPEILHGILLIEYYNRGDMLNRFFERIMLKIAPNYLVALDASLGVGQIKISTASELLYNNDRIEVANMLLTDKSNIKICAMLLKHYLTYIDSKLNSFNDIFLLLSKLYLAGTIYIPTYAWIEFYSDILRWAVSKKLYKKSINSKLFLKDVLN